MLSIGTALPHDNATLQAGLAHGLTPLGIGANAVSLEGEFPQLAALRLNLTGARFHRGLAIPRPAEAATKLPLGFVRQVEIQAAPAHLESVPATLHVLAEDVVLATVAAETGNDARLLVLDRAGHGTLDLSVERTALESALRAAGHAAAQAKGAEVTSVSLDIQNESPRVLSIRILITAKAMFFTTTISISGRLEVNDRLEARLSDLQCEGDGMIGKMAAGALRPQFEKIQSRTIPLGTAIAGLTLRDVEITGGASIRVHASFGSQN